MMRQADGDRDVGLRQRVHRGVAGQNRNRRSGWRRPQIEADHLRAEFLANFFKQSPLPAADIEHFSRILTQPAENGGGISQQALRPRQIAICLGDNVFREEWVFE